MGGIEPPTNFFFKVGGLTGSEFSEGGGGACGFYIKNKLKSEIIYIKKTFINKNLFTLGNSKNLVTLQRWDGV